MITLYSGTPGSGKSLDIARTIYDKLRYKKDSIIICNFEINTKKIKNCKGHFIYVDNENLTPERLQNFSRRWSKHFKRRPKEGQFLLIIDECQLLFNAREWNVKGRSEWLSFFTQHRKYGYNVILVAQFDRMIDRQVRSLIEYEDIHRKVVNAGKIGTLLKPFFGKRQLFVSVHMWYPLQQRLGAEFFTGHSKYYRIYDTFGTFAETVPADGRGGGVPARSGDRSCEGPRVYV